jgi:hypothetical protein
MRLSGLQKFIIIETYLSPNKTKFKADFYVFYAKEKLRKTRKAILDVIHKSIESLVSRDLLVAYGRKTGEKWFVDRVKITSRGRKAARELIFRKQRKLPIG